MEISLREINQQNYTEIVDLSVSKEQEGLLFPNIWSLLEYKFEDGLTVKEFYASFGFVETGLDDEDRDMLAVIEL